MLSWKLLLGGNHSISYTGCRTESAESFRRTSPRSSQMSSQRLDFFSLTTEINLVEDVRSCTLKGRHFRGRIRCTYGSTLFEALVHADHGNVALEFRFHGRSSITGVGFCTTTTHWKTMSAVFLDRRLS